MFDPNDPPVASVPPVADAPAAEPPVSAAVERFNTCRWKSTDSGRFCTHRDVLPLAGKDGFNAEAWCPECTFFKVRRTARKREPNPFGYGY